MIKVGERIPAVTIKRLGDSGQVDVTSDELFKGKKVVMFSVPGAFTGPCSKIHLPGYVARAADLKAKGVDEVMCLGVNDAFVMKGWADATGATGVITMVADGNGTLTRALGLEFDGSGAGLGAVRARRAAMIIDDGVVSSIEVEDKNGEVTVSGAEACAVRL
jgi:peroxiredoxin